MKGLEDMGANDEKQCVALCKRGDLDAFEELVRRHQKKMLNIAYRMIGNYEEHGLREMARYTRR